MGMLWIVKLYWLWIILGAIMLIKSIFSISIIGMILGGIILGVGFVFKKVMSSDNLRNRIDKNL